MQQIFSELWRNLSPEAQNVLKENGLDSYEKMKPWIIGVRKDFPKADTETRHELEDFIIEIREKMLERLTINTNLPEKKEEKLEETKVVETPEKPVAASKEDAKKDIPAQTEECAGRDNDVLQNKYKYLLSLHKYTLAKSFSDKKKLLEVSEVIRLRNADAFEKERYNLDGKKWNYKTKEYLNFLELLDELFHPQNEITSNDTEFGEEDNNALDLSQERYEELLRNNDKAKKFVVHRKGLLDKVEQVRTIWKSGSLTPNTGIIIINGEPNRFRNPGYVEFYKVLRELFTGNTELYGSDDDLVKKYTEENGHPPMFYILNKFLANAKKDSDVIFARFYGAKDPYVPETKENLAKDYGYEATESVLNTVQSISNKSDEFRKIKNSNYWEEYSSVFSRGCIFDISEDSACLSIRQKENDVAETVVAAALALKGFGIKYLWKDLNTKSKNYKLNRNYPENGRDVLAIAINNKLSGYMFQKVINEFTPTRDTELRRSLIDSETYWTGERKPNDLSEDDYKALEEALKILFRKFLPEINISEDNKILHIEGERDYIEDIVEILKEDEKTEPVKVSKVMERLREKYPDEPRFQNLTVFKRFVTRDKTNKISLVGRKKGDNSLMVLVEWGWWTKGLPQLVKDIIIKANRPVSQKEIEGQISNKLYEYRNDLQNVIGMLKNVLRDRGNYQKLQKNDEADTDTYYILSGSNFDKGMFFKIDD